MERNFKKYPSRTAFQSKIEQHQPFMAQRSMLPETKTYLLQLEVSKGFAELKRIELRTLRLNQS